MGTKKRMSEWTLAECKEYCEKRKDKTPLEVTDPKTGTTKTMWNYFCQDCELMYICRDRPSNWNLDTLTGREKNIMRACGAKFATLNDLKNANVKLWREKPRADTCTYYLPDGDAICIIDRSLFPSVSGGDCIALED